MIEKLPRRERELYEIVCRLGEATAAQVRAEIGEPPSYSAVRTLLSRLGAKGLLTHHERDQAYVYRSTPPGREVRDTALRNLADMFFQGSGVDAATALLGLTRAPSEAELKKLQAAIDSAAKRS